MIDIVPLFSECILKSNIQRQFSEKEIKFISQQYQSAIKNSHNITSNNWNILDCDELSELKIFVQNNINYYLHNVINPSGEVEIYLTQSWLNWTRKDESHPKHSHPNSVLSGILYINANENYDSIVFEREQNPFLFRIESKEYNHFNYNTLHYKVKTGDIIVFGSKINHSVKKSINPELRISLAFNTMIKGEISSNKTLSKLKI